MKPLSNPEKQNLKRPKYSKVRFIEERDSQDSYK